MIGLVTCLDVLISQLYLIYRELSFQLYWLMVENIRHEKKIYSYIKTNSFTNFEISSKQIQKKSWLYPESPLRFVWKPFLFLPNILEISSAQSNTMYIIIRIILTGSQEKDKSCNLLDLSSKLHCTLNAADIYIEGVVQHHYI